MDFGEDENRSLRTTGPVAGTSAAQVSWVLAMRVIDEARKANRLYAKGFRSGDLPMPPRRKIAILVCMDERLTVEPMLGLKTGDAHIIRNAGGIATDDAVRSLSGRLREVRIAAG